MLYQRTLGQKNCGKDDFDNRSKLSEHHTDPPAQKDQGQHHSRPFDLATGTRVERLIAPANKPPYQDSRMGNAPPDPVRLPCDGIEQQGANQDPGRAHDKAVSSWAQPVAGGRPRRIQRGL